MAARIRACGTGVRSDRHGPSNHLLNPSRADTITRAGHLSICTRAGSTEFGSVLIRTGERPVSAAGAVKPRSTEPHHCKADNALAGRSRLQRTLMQDLAVPGFGTQLSTVNCRNS
jgi:hypothetical protein